MFNFDVFNIVFLKIVSNLLSVFIGFAAGKWAGVQRESIAQLLFYFLGPIVFFSAPASSNLNLSTISVTFVMFVICSYTSLASYYISSKIWSDSTKNLLGMSGGSSNCGYFMMPIAAEIFDQTTFNLYAMIVIGVALYESSLGYYLCVKSFSSTKESVKRVLKLPMFNAFVFGVLFGLSGFCLPSFLTDFTKNTRIAYSILGMIMIGLSLSNINKLEIDYKFTIASLLSKFILQPLGVVIFVLFDFFLFKIYDQKSYYAMILVSIAPISASTIIMSSIISFSVEKAATAVFISAVIGLVFIPLVIAFFLT